MITRVQMIDGEPVIEVTETVVKKEQYRESSLLDERSYFLGLQQKANEGLARVDALLTQINNEKTR